MLPIMLGYWPVRQGASRQHGLRACCAHTLDSGLRTNSKEGKTQVASIQQFLKWSERDPKHFLTLLAYKNEWCFTKKNQWQVDKRIKCGWSCTYMQRSGGDGLLRFSVTASRGWERCTRKVSTLFLPRPRGWRLQKACPK